MNSILQKARQSSEAERLAYITAVGVFLPFYIAIAVFAIVAGYILIKKDCRESLFKTFGIFFIFLFGVYSFAVAVIAKNTIGYLAALMFFVVFIIGRYLRAVMSRDFLERLLNVIIAASYFAILSIFIEKLLHLKDIWYRCCGNIFGNKSLSFYGHENYLGTLMATVIIICAYKFVTLRDKRLRYVISAILSGIVILLTQSMFAWIEVLVGLTVLLIMRRKYGLLSIMWGLGALAGGILLLFPEIFPRTAHIGSSFESRIGIWNNALEFIGQKPWFGRGFFTYWNEIANTTGNFIVKHSHNIAIDLILCFGIVGTAIIFILLFILVQRILLCRNFLKSGTVTALVLSVLTAMLIHSIIDMTMIWVQTSMLYLMIFATLGAEENKMTQILSRLPHNNKEADKNV